MIAPPSSDRLAPSRNQAFVLVDPLAGATSGPSGIGFGATGSGAGVTDPGVAGGWPATITGEPVGDADAAADDAAAALDADGSVAADGAADGGALAAADSGPGGAGVDVAVEAATVPVGRGEVRGVGGGVGRGVGAGVAGGVGAGVGWEVGCGVGWGVGVGVGGSVAWVTTTASGRLSVGSIPFTASARKMTVHVPAGSCDVVSHVPFVALPPMSARSSVMPASTISAETERASRTGLLA